MRGPNKKTQALMSLETYPTEIVDVFEESRNTRNNLESVAEYLSSLNSEGSRKTMFFALKRALDLIGVKFLEYDYANLNERVVQKMINLMLRQGYSPETINLTIAALKGVATRLWVNGAIDTRDFQLIKMIKIVRGSRTGHGRMLERQELDLLFSNLDKEYNLRNLRDAALFAIMVECGLRREECASLQIKDLYLDEEIPFLRVIGKGNKERQVPIPKGALNRLKRYLLEYAKDVNDILVMQGRAQKAKYKKQVEWLFTYALAHPKEELYLFLKICPHGSISSNFEKITGHRIYNIIASRVAEFEMDKWTPHDLRRTCASTLLERDVDINTVKNYLGHSDISTTSRYDRRGYKQVEKAAEVLDLVKKRFKSGG